MDILFLYMYVHTCIDHVNLSQSNSTPAMASLFPTSISLDSSVSNDFKNSSDLSEVIVFILPVV